MQDDGPTGRSRRRLIELAAVLACTAVMVFVGSSLATAGGGSGKPGQHATGPTGVALKHNCKKYFKGSRKYRKCRHRHRGKGTLHAPGQQK